MESMIPTSLSKKCTGCKQILPVSEFPACRSNRFGLYGTCKKCSSARSMAYYWKNRDEVRKKRKLTASRDHKKRYARDRERILRRARERNATPAGKRAYRIRLLREYGLTIEDYDRMFAYQQGLCALCKQPQTGDRPLYVDHHHGEKRVRGLLCLRCNQALEREDRFPGWLKRSASYLDGVVEVAA